MRLLITGANGMIGRRLAEECVRCGHEVTAVILEGTDAAGLEGVRVVSSRSPADLDLSGVVEGRDLVFNLVGNMRGSRASAYVDANVRYPALLLSRLAAMERPPRFVHVSSVSAVGPSRNGKPLDESSPCDPVGMYGSSKREGETAVLRQAGRLPVLVVRPPSVYGPADTCFLDLFRWARRGVFPKLCTRAKRFNLVHRDDLAAALAALAPREWRSGEVLHLGPGEVHTDEDLARALEAAAGRPLRRLFVPRPLVSLLALAARLQEVLTGEPQLMSASKVQEMSEPDWIHDFSGCARFCPGLAFTPLAEGVRATWRWYEERGWL